MAAVSLTLGSNEYPLTVVDGTALTLSLSGPAGPAGPTGATGATGAAGPNTVSTSTTTNLTGYIYGNGTTVGGATAATSAATANTLVLRNASGDASFGAINASSTITTTGDYATVSTNGVGAYVSTFGADAFISTSGTNASISTSGSNADIFTVGDYATISTSGDFAHISTSGTDANITTGGTYAAIYTIGSDALISTYGENAYITTAGTNAFIATEGSSAFIQSRATFKLFNGTYTTTLSHAPTDDRAIAFPNASGTVALINPSSGTQTFSGAQSFSSTTRPTSSGTGPPEATSLITRADAVDEIIFNMARIQRSDNAQAYTANGGTSSLVDGDNLNTGAAANNRPVCVRYRQINRFGSGANAAVCPIRIASYGGYGHGATANVGSKIRCGIGMALGASIPAANANALAGRGFGWEIYWDGTNIVFGLFAHDGTTYVTTDGASGRSAAIATGQNPSNFDGFFHIIVGLSAGVVSAWTVFTNNPVAPMRVSGTPTLTLAGGPTTGNNFATSGVQWACVNHSTNTAAGSTSIKVLDRLLIMD